jgi:protein-disulfide isomerase
MEKRRYGTRPLLLAVISGLMVLWACGGPGSQEVNEIRDQQKQILAKLGEIEKAIIQAGDKIAARAQQPQQAQQPSGPNADTAYELPVGASPIKGPQNAPVTITEFSDYQCPYCARNEPLIADMLKAYPEKARFVFKHFPLVSIHQNAMPAAKAAVAAQKQGKFWEMHEKLFTNQRALGEQQIKQYAQEIGLDMAKFETDMNSPEVQKQIQDDMALANKVGVRGTPTVFVNGKILQSRSLDGFKQMAEVILKGKG